MKTAWFVAGAVLVAATQALALSPKQIYKKSGPAVVLLLGSDGGSSGSGGTGSIITPEGKVITNAHVVVNEQGNPFKILYVFLKPSTITGDNSRDLANRYKARVLGFSPADELDLALVQIENPPADLPTLSFGNPDEVEIGDDVVAIGHPERGGLWTLTKGTVSTVIANFAGVKGKHVFQSDVSINRGNSGGPMIDTEGNMVGINTMIARMGAGGVAITGVNFSLKASVAVKWLAGQGMGLAYAPTAEEPVVVAMAPQARQARPSAPDAASAHPPPPREPQSTTVASAEQPREAEPAPPARSEERQPAATIVVAQKPPEKPPQAEALRSEGASIGKEKQSEKLVAGKPLDPKTAKPKYLTKRRPFDIDDLRAKQMKELEEMMDEMRGVVDQKNKSRGMGLW